MAVYAYDLRAFFQVLGERDVSWVDVELDTVAEFVRWLEQSADNVVVLITGTEPARERSSVARSVNAVHAFFDYHSTQGVPVAQRLVSFSRTPKPQGYQT